MTHFVLKVAVAAIGIGAASILPAQSFEKTYASVRGWNVSSVYDNGGAFVYCAANFETRGASLRIATDGQTWGIGTNSTLRGQFTGQLEIDNRGGQRGFDGGDDGWGTTQLAGWEVADLKKGSIVGIEAGEGFHEFSLSGSTAAMLKAEECATNAGSAPVKRVAPKVTAKVTRPSLQQEQWTVGGDWEFSDGGSVNARLTLRADFSGIYCQAGQCEEMTYDDYGDYIAFYAFFGDYFEFSLNFEDKTVLGSIWYAGTSMDDFPAGTISMYYIN